MPRKRPSTNQFSTTRPKSYDKMQQTASYPCRKSNPTSKPNSPPSARTTPSYFVLDTILPSHVVSDRSLFTTYTPSNRVYRSAFGNDIKIVGTGDVEICVQAGAGKTITFTVRDCWHIPSSSHNFLSCLTVTSPTRRHQVMLAARTPRLLFPHKDRLATPNLPKYVPFTREQGFFVLKFKLPSKLPVHPEPVTSHTLSGTRSQGCPSLSLHASSRHPYAGLAFTQHPFCSSSHSLLASSMSTQTNFHVPSSNSPIEVPISPLSHSIPNFQPQSITHSHNLTTLAPPASLTTTISPMQFQHNPQPQQPASHLQYQQSPQLPFPATSYSVVYSHATSSLPFTDFAFRPHSVFMPHQSTTPDTVITRPQPTAPNLSSGRPIRSGMPTCGSHETVQPLCHSHEPSPTPIPASTSLTTSSNAILVSAALTDSPIQFRSGAGVSSTAERDRERTRGKESEGERGMAEKRGILKAEMEGEMKGHEGAEKQVEQLKNHTQYQHQQQQHHNPGSFSIYSPTSSTRRPISRPSSRASTFSPHLSPIRPDTSSAPASPLGHIFHKPSNLLPLPLWNTFELQVSESQSVATVAQGKMSVLPEKNGIVAHGTLTTNQRTQPP